jgi:hypothetical protein
LFLTLIFGLAGIDQILLRVQLHQDLPHAWPGARDGRRRYCSPAGSVRLDSIVGSLGAGVRKSNVSSLHKGNGESRLVAWFGSHLPCY